MLLDKSIILTEAERTALVKWMYGCMNQRFTIRGRVAKRGEVEFDKVQAFVFRAAQTLARIIRRIEEVEK